MPAHRPALGLIEADELVYNPAQGEIIFCQATMIMRTIFVFLLSCANVAWASADSATVPQFFLPQTSLEAKDLAVIVNDNDPLSRRVGDYYQQRRNIPHQNIIHIRFAPGVPVLTQSEFARIKQEVDRKTPKSVQALALAWTLPFGVECMSITSAFAFGFNTAYCSSECGATKSSRYFNSASTAPYDDLKIRPAMLLAAPDFDQARALIDRGIKADGSQPPGTAYLLSTSDSARNVRAVLYPAIIEQVAKSIDIKSIQSDFIKDKDDVMFYFTGLISVPHLETLKFRPGAIADHLTSSGGQLNGTHQMSSLRWLEAGATGSFGTVVEPCNHLAKFPNPGVVMHWYLAGNSLLEAYWKSVQWPGEGIFIGEPLAKPYGEFSVTKDNGDIVLRTQALPAGKYSLLGANSIVGPFSLEPETVAVKPGKNELRFKNLNKAVYRLIPLP